MGPRAYTARKRAVQAAGKRCAIGRHRRCRYIQMQTDTQKYRIQRGDLRAAAGEKIVGIKIGRVKQQQNIIQLVPCIVPPMLSPIRLPNQLVNPSFFNCQPSAARQTKSTYPVRLFRF